MKRTGVKEHSTAYKVGGLGLKTLRRVSKNFPTELSVHIDYFMVGERVRFLFTSCGVCDSPQRVNKNRTREPTMK